jgi:ribose/xylose/arabinose/galactoside ABC-type transport system permease subunit
VLGGHGSYWGTVAGALSLTLISVLLPQLELSEAQLQVVYGLIILAGIYLARAGLVVAQRQRSTPASKDDDQATDGMRTQETTGVTR